jgi:hypothetical protein
MALEIQVMAWDRYMNVAGLNRLMGSRAQRISGITFIGYAQNQKINNNIVLELYIKPMYVVLIKQSINKPILSIVMFFMS